ncbi:hypothetical protein [Alienimonas californiensis]|uniref:Uncharacterized protein n=1 Tax=Alienimonas californiensis TaxID=2527989 RepID=A0A517PBI5_9PLAN|nr:hypothetical protein [Alienimonas californiensis]QDT16743.1 hypothetical protein CA12_28500 [Alienimonas californiensis]
MSTTYAPPPRPAVDPPTPQTSGSTAADGKMPAGEAGESYTARAELLPVEVTVRPTGPNNTPEVIFTDVGEDVGVAVLERRFFFSTDDWFSISSVKTAVAAYRGRRSGRRVGARRASVSVMKALRDAFEQAADAGAPVAPYDKAVEPTARPGGTSVAEKTVLKRPFKAGSPKTFGPATDRPDEAAASSTEAERPVGEAPHDPWEPQHERPRLAVRTLARGDRDAALGLVECSLPRPGRRLPQQAADFLTMLAANELRVLYAEGVNGGDPASGSHVGFTVLAELPGKTPEELTALLTEQARDLLGGDFETV